MSDSADIGSAHGKITIGSDLRGIDQAKAALKDIEGRSKATDAALSSFAKTGAVLGLGIAAGLGSTVNAFQKFETGMLAVKAVSSATGEEFELLTELAKQIGKDTVFSASEAAGALEELAKAGVSVPDILNGAAEGATALAAAAGEGLPQAALQIATALNEFELAGDQATRVADIFANVSNKSAASAQSFGDALTYVGTQAHTLNIPLEQTAAAIAALADAGLDGSTAGTSLNAALSSLVAPTKKQLVLQKQLGLQVKDAAGNFVGLDSILVQLAESTKNLGDAEKQQLLALLFEERGARAVNVLLNTQNTILADGTTAWQDYNEGMLETGTAARQAETRLSGLGGSFEQLRGSIETAQIELGENFAPVVKATADSLTSLVNAFSSLGEGTQTAIVAVAATAGGLLLLGAAGAKAITVGRDIKNAWRTLGKSFGDAQKGCSNASGCLDSLGKNATTATGKLGPLTGALKGLAAIGVIVVGVEIVTSAKAFVTEGGNQDILGIPITDLGIKAGHIFADVVGKVGADGLAEALENNIDANEIGLAIQDSLKGAGFTIDTKAFAGVIPAGALDAEVRELGVTVGELLSLSQKWGLSIEETAVRLKTEQQAIKDTAEASRDFADGQRGLLDGTEAQTDATESLADITGDATRQWGEALTEQERLAQATGLSVEELQAQADAEEDAAKAAEAFAKEIGEITTESLIAQGSLVNLGRGVTALNTGINRVTDTTEGAILQLNKFGNIRLTKANREALELSRTLEHTEDALDRTADAIANNSEDMSMWQGRISLVDEILGDSTDTYSQYAAELAEGTITQEEFNDAVADGRAHVAFQNLNELVASGRLSQAEANEILEKGIWLRERSVGALEDEQAEQARLIPILADYVKAHDEANGAVNRLTDAQKAFLAVSQSDPVQEFLQTFALLKAIGADETSLKLFIDSSAADPLVKAFLQDIGLIPSEVNVNLTAENANQVLDDLNGKADAFVSLDGKTVTVSVESKEDALQFATENAEALDGKVVEFVIQTDDGPVKATLEEIKTEAGKGVDVPVTVTMSDAQARAAIAVTTGGGSLPGTAIAIPPPPPIEITAEDKTAAGVNSAKTNIGTVSEVAAPEGKETGEAFAAGLENKQGEVTVAADALRTVVNTSFQQTVNAARAWGEATGLNWTSAFANAIASGSGWIYDAAFAVAANALAGAKAALGIASPSREAQKLAGNFTDTFGDSLIAGGAGAANASRQFITRSLTPFDDLAMRSLFDARTIPASTLAGRSVSGGGMVLNAGGIAVTVNGAGGDPDTIANRVRSEVVDGIERFIAGRA